MLVVISDLHFQDTNNDVVEGGGQRFPGREDLSRNISPGAFDLFLKDVKQAVVENLPKNPTGKKEVVLLLAGDIFDLNRSQRWLLEGSGRPYNAPAGEWEKTAINIMEDIVDCNQGFFGRLKDFRQSISSDPEIKCTVEYIPGNHDRLVNLSGNLRRRVVAALGLDWNPANEFDRIKRYDEFGVLVRHGHEYDPANFGEKLTDKNEVPENISPDSYKSSNLGEYMTIDVAARLAYEFRTRYRNEILAGVATSGANTLHRDLYLTLLEFDDVRPQASMLKFIDYQMGARAEGAKSLYFPILEKIFEDAFNNDTFTRNLKKVIGRFKYGQLWASFKVSEEFAINRIINHVSDIKPWQMAFRETVLRQDAPSDIRYIVAGHTHMPTFESQFRAPNGREYFFFDTGTWRKVISKNNDEETFNSAKTMTYVVFYNSMEDVDSSMPGKSAKAKKYSFDYWSGFTKKQ